MLQKGDKKLIHSWAFYDWANSVYSLVISTAVFPIYYETVTQTESGLVNFFGLSINNTSLYSYALSFSFLIVAFISPLLSGIADHYKQPPVNRHCKKPDYPKTQYWQKRKTRSQPKGFLFLQKSKDS